jgi:hypothetical protein
MDRIEVPIFVTPIVNVDEVLDLLDKFESVYRRQFKVFQFSINFFLALSIKDCIAQEKKAAQNSTRILPDLPSTSNKTPYSKTQ